jgi:hypothetical protein
VNGRTTVTNAYDARLMLLLGCPVGDVRRSDVVTAIFTKIGVENVNSDLATLAILLALAGIVSGS